MPRLLSLFLSLIFHPQSNLVAQVKLESILALKCSIRITGTTRDELDTDIYALVSLSPRLLSHSKCLPCAVMESGKVILVLVLAVEIAVVIPVTVGGTAWVNWMGEFTVG